MRFYSKQIKRLIKALIGALPYNLKAPVVRRLFKFESQIRPEIEVKVAETIDELTAAFEIVRAEYSKVGYLDSIDQWSFRHIY